MKTIWKICEADQRLQEKLGASLGVSPLFAQLLLNRDIRTTERAQEFLFGDIASVADPFLMKDMDRAVARISKAIDNNEKILIYGDYDVDGITSVALLAYVFDKMGATYETLLPNRLKEGYGLNAKDIASSRERGVGLIVTVDCGVNSVAEIECANEYGMEVVITDHHAVKEETRPDAFAIVDPHRSDCSYPFQYLAGVGVAYKLAQALMPDDPDFVNSHLDLVALGTIADIVPLDGENRVLTKAGLKQLRNTLKPGLKALMDVAGVDPGKVTCRSIGFALGPRINAMGRVGSADAALDLMLCKDDPEAYRIAQVLDQKNKKRRSLEKDILDQAISRVEGELDLEEEKVIVLADKAWHPGVIGIVASRLTETYLKPAILIALEGDNGKGSGRGVEGFDLFEAINRSGEYLVDFGGHKQACGIRIKTENVPRFRESLNRSVGQDVIVKEDIAIKELMVDLSLPFSRVGVKLINELALLMPYGLGNPEPVFSTGGIQVKNRPRDIGRTGFKFLATCGNLTCEAITFKKNSVQRPRQGDIIDLAYTPSINSWGGIDSIQLNIKDLRIVG